MARILKVKEKEIFFTSGGTESNNLALFGAAQANARKWKTRDHYSSGACSSRAANGKAGGKMGYEVTVLPVDHTGVVDMKALEEALRPDTILVSTMYVNNEVGAVMPVEKIGALVHEKSPKALYHVDAIQAFGKYTIHPKKTGIDRCCKQ